MAVFRQVAVACQPHLSGDYIRTVSEEIVRRAKVIGEAHPVDFHGVALFLLERSTSWVSGGLPVAKIGEKLPKDLSSLGMMKIAEGGKDGQPMTREELAAVGLPKIKLN